MGNEAWSNTSNASTTNTSYATYTDTSATGSQYLKATGFGFSVPGGATINGIQLSIVHKANNSGAGGSGRRITDQVVSLCKAGSVVGSNKFNGTKWALTDETYTYGGSADLWGTTWTVAEVNNSGFGAVLQAVGNRADGTETGSVDSFAITITYTGGGSNTYNESTTGDGTRADGTATLTRYITVSSSGDGSRAAGTGTVQEVVNVSSTGDGLRCAGSADNSVIGSGTISGGLTAGGTGSVMEVITITSTGDGTRAGGSASIGMLITAASTGDGVRCGGAADSSVIAAGSVMEGGLTAGGTGFSFVTYSLSPSGGVLVDGGFIGAIVTETSTGGVLVTGTADGPIIGEGGVLASGAAVVAYSQGIPVSGGVLGGGTAVPSLRFANTGSGGVILGGHGVPFDNDIEWSINRIDELLFKLRFQSHQPVPVRVRIYKEGLLLPPEYFSVDGSGEAEITIGAGESPYIEIIDTDDIPHLAFQGAVTLNWETVSSASYYLVQEQIGVTWITRAQVIEDGRQVYLWKSRWLPEGDHSFRIVPKDTSGSEGTPFIRNTRIVRHPDSPHTRASFSGSAITITAV